MLASPCRVLCPHAEPAICARPPLARASPCTPQKAKKSGESESGSADSDNGDLAADREVDTATLEAQVAKLRQLVVSVRAVPLLPFALPLGRGRTPRKEAAPCLARRSAHASASLLVGSLSGA